MIYIFKIIIKKQMSLFHCFSPNLAVLVSNDFPSSSLPLFCSNGKLTRSLHWHPWNAAQYIAGINAISIDMYTRLYETFKWRDRRSEEPDRQNSGSFLDILSLYWSVYQLRHALVIARRKRELHQPQSDWISLHAGWKSKTRFTTWNSCFSRLMLAEDTRQPVVATCM